MQPSLMRGIVNAFATRAPLARAHRSASLLVTASERNDFAKAGLYTHAPVAPAAHKTSVETKQSPPARQDIAPAGSRSFFTSLSLRQFPRDSGIGAGGGGPLLWQHPPIHGEKSVAEMAGRHEYAIDLPFRDVLGSQKPEDRPALMQKYEEARLDIQKGAGDKPDDTFSSSMARQLLHVPCERRDLFGKYPKIYSTYSRPLAETALARNGTYNMHLGYLCMIQHFRSIADTTIRNDGKSPVSLVSTCSTVGLKEAGLSITSAELIDSMEGPLRNTIDQEQERRSASGNPVVAVKVTAPAGQPLDARTFQEAHNRAFKATISPENQRCYKETGKFTPEARKAVQDVQQLVRGTTAALPDERSLRTDATLGDEGQRHRWPTGGI